MEVAAGVEGDGVRATQGLGNFGCHDVGLEKLVSEIFGEQLAGMTERGISLDGEGFTSVGAEQGAAEMAFT